MHGAAVHGLPYSADPVELGRVALARLGLVGKGNERDRRPTLGEIEALIRYFRENNFQIIPVDKIIRFAIATAMRLGEICNATWEDLNDRNNTLLIRDRKDPRHKKGNHMRIPLLDVSGYDARAILEEQRFSTEGKGRIFPYNGKSAGTASDVPVMNLRSRTCTSKTCVTKAQAACLKLASASSRSPWSPGTRIGRCSAAIPT
ncbi:tyrosine-type recombinase/integrase [Mesorhizobium sp. M0615]|uniref:tyrosine-type recombinase/integrase n=1 Tax=unclassified Mesorhizobium TaxID=325217 RepID=UPI002475087E|nr:MULTISPECIES: tyrosine-type recombinase/integrase [unclassified Mesorhizobium]